LGEPCRRGNIEIRPISLISAVIIFARVFQRVAEFEGALRASQETKIPEMLYRVVGKVLAGWTGCATG
jgi:hypothetical protein